MVVPRHPPLPCRASPPQGGRWDFLSAFANRQRQGATAKLPISPLFGPETSRTGVRRHREQFRALCAGRF
ncbi:MAG: hypothetical protein EOS12_11720, partial [Mesorhizobium sp.]